MKYTLKGSGSHRRLTLHREEGDPRIKDDSHLLYHVRNQFIAWGFDVIKKLMWKDGHMTADTQHYVRCRNKKKAGFCIYWEAYAVRNAIDDLREDGHVSLDMIFWPADTVIAISEELVTI